MTNHQIAALSQVLGVKLVPQPSKYLGVTFKHRGKRVEDFQDLIDKVSARLQSWKSKLLSLSLSSRETHPHKFCPHLSPNLYILSF